MLADSQSWAPLGAQGALRKCTCGAVGLAVVRLAGVHNSAHVRQAVHVDPVGVPLRSLLAHLHPALAIRPWVVPGRTSPFSRSRAAAQSGQGPHLSARSCPALYKPPCDVTRNNQGGASSTHMLPVGWTQVVSAWVHSTIKSHFQGDLAHLELREEGGTSHTLSGPAAAVLPGLEGRGRGRSCPKAPRGRCSGASRASLASAANTCARAQLPEHPLPLRLCRVHPKVGV